MLEAVPLEGRHVRLEPLTLAHAPALAAAASGPRDSFAFTWVPHDEPSAVAWIQAALDGQAAGTVVPYATIDLASGIVVGSTRFLDIQYWNWEDGNPNQRGAHLPDAVEIGYTWLAPSAQRTAINTEAKLLMLTHAFDVWCVHRVRLITDARNQRSRTAIERLGARFDGVLRAARDASDGTVRDSAYYSILESEWPAVRKALTQRLNRD